jgi:hypothetical protein
VSPRKPGDDTPFTFLVTADAGIGAISKEELGGATHNDPPVNGADAVAAAMLRDQLPTDEFLVLNGDISYARGWAWIWERYFDMVQPLSVQLPWMTTVGNHGEFIFLLAFRTRLPSVVFCTACSRWSSSPTSEVDTSANPLKLASGGDSGGECGVATIKRFPHYPSLDEMWYSFSFGTVHCIMLSSEHPAKEQVAFFEREMSVLDRKVTPWALVFLHRPLFGSEKRDTLDMNLAAVWHQHFVKYGVDMVLTGHEHFYERLCAVETEVSCASSRDRPVYIIDGSAGAEFSPANYTPPSNISEYKDFSHWGYSRISVMAEALTFTHYRTNNVAVDEVTLPRVT